MEQLGLLHTQHIQENAHFTLGILHTTQLGREVGLLGGHKIHEMAWPKLSGATSSERRPCGKQSYYHSQTVDHTHRKNKFRKDLNNSCR